MISCVQSVNRYKYKDEATERMKLNMPDFNTRLEDT